jgi:hypothetical protein
MVSTDKSVAMTGFFDEVKRRKVYKVAAAYIIAAGGIIQLASAAFPAWDLPNWLLRLVIVLLLMGFPIALILAWAYDVTAQGSPPKHSHARRNWGDHFRWCRFFSFASGFGAQMRQVNCGAAL